MPKHLNMDSNQSFDNIDKEIPADDSATKDERLFLYSLIKMLKPITCLEIGTHKGLSTLYMTQALYENGKGVMHTCDPINWDAEGNFRKFPELERLIRYNQIKGKDMDVYSIDFAFVDGDHTAPEVMHEIKMLMPRLSKHAVVIFHDCTGGSEVNIALENCGVSTWMLNSANGIRMYVQ